MTDINPDQVRNNSNDSVLGSVVAAIGVVVVLVIAGIFYVESRLEETFDKPLPETPSTVGSSSSYSKPVSETSVDTPSTAESVAPEGSNAFVPEDVIPESLRGFFDWLSPIRKRAAVGYVRGWYKLYYKENIEPGIKTPGDAIRATKFSHCIAIQMAELSKEAGWEEMQEYYTDEAAILLQTIRGELDAAAYARWEKAHESEFNRIVASDRAEMFKILNSMGTGVESRMDELAEAVVDRAKRLVRSLRVPE